MTATVLIDILDREVLDACLNACASVLH